MKKIAIGCDHGGFALKQAVLAYLKDRKIPFEDVGCVSETSVDYPDFALAVAEKISSGEASRGILVCGTGIGMAITANKVPGVRAAAIVDLFSARMSRLHNDLNVLCLGGRLLAPALACEIIGLFLDTPFEGGRHEKRVEKINQLLKS